MYAHTGAVDHLQFLALGLVAGDDGVHQHVPHTCLQPAVETIVNRCVRPVSFRQVSPRHARSKNEEDAIQHPPVIHSRPTAQLAWQKRLNCLPLKLGQVVAAAGHGKLLYGV
jgi:hypothetical protein